MSMKTKGKVFAFVRQALRPYLSGAANERMGAKADRRQHTDGWPRAVRGDPA
jgi:hypothetical protein